MKDVNVKVENLPEVGIVLTILEGKALDPQPPQKIALSGDIRTVSHFITIRKAAGAGLQTVDLKKAVLIVDKAALSINLLLDPESAYGAQVHGRLEMSDELKVFHINGNHTFKKEELVHLIKFNKLNFDDVTKHKELLLAFQKTSSTVNIRANDSADERGNKERAFIKEVTTNAPTEFMLNIPIYKNFPAERFQVEICLDVIEGNARYWFESVILHELTLSLSDQIFNEQLKDCAGFVIIYK